MPTLLGLAGDIVMAFLDEGLGHAGDFRDAAVEPHGGVDAVGEQVAGDAAAGHADVKPPQALAALGEVLGNGPVLQELGAVVEDLAELAFVDQLLGQGHGGHAAVIVPDHVGHLGLLDGVHHLARIRRRSGPAAFRTSPSCRPWRRRWRFPVGVVGAGDIDEVDILALDQFAPIGFD